ncbi:hypothetical protein ACLB2K_008346 [Fragaria x ananassa]
MVVWNPATKQFRFVPKTDDYYLLGFEFFHDIRDYKVVSILLPDFNNTIRAKVFTGNTNSWREVKSHYCCSARPFFLGTSRSITLNGVLYSPLWIQEQRSHVLSFNLRDEVFHVIPLPESSSTDRMKLLSWKNSLAFIGGPNYEPLREIWVMTESLLLLAPPSIGTLGRAVYTVGFWIRETGQAIDRLGSRLQGNYFFKEQLSRHRTLMNVFEKAPEVDKEAFVAPSASIIGQVQVGRGSSIWYGCVLRVELGWEGLPTIIGDNVTVGHSAVLHGCTVEDEAFVGMAATLLDGVYVEKHAMVAAGALVRQNTRIPCGEVWGGNPAKLLRKLTEDEMAFISQSAINYANLAQVHAAENAKELDSVEFEKVLRKKFGRRDEDYDTMFEVVRQTSPEATLPDNVAPPPKAA